MNERASQRYRNTAKKLFAFVAAYGSVCLTGLFCYLYLSTFIWQKGDIFYPVLHFLNNYKETFFVIGLAGGIIIILIYDYKKMYHLVEDEVRQAKQRADEAEQRKNDLVVYLAHDLKTPLTSVMGYLELLQDEPDLQEETRQHYIQVVSQKTERLEDLINEFFEITRFSLSSITLEYSNVNLTRLLEQLTYEFRPMLLEKNLSCSLEAAPDIPLRCDVNQMQRVFDNLLRNAVNYSFEGGTIRICVQQEGEQLRISFFNRGNTIPKEKLDRIFEQFYRLDSARSSRSGGAGLGLAIAKEIVELHQGTIAARSEDESIEFEVTIPGGAA